MPATPTPTSPLVNDFDMRAFFGKLTKLPAEERMPFYEKCLRGGYSREERDKIVRVLCTPFAWGWEGSWANRNRLTRDEREEFKVMFSNPVLWLRSLSMSANERRALIERTPDLNYEQINQCLEHAPGLSPDHRKEFVRKCHDSEASAQDVLDLLAHLRNAYPQFIAHARSLILKLKILKRGPASEQPSAIDASLPAELRLALQEERRLEQEVSGLGRSIDLRMVPLQFMFLPNTHEFFDRSFWSVCRFLKAQGLGDYDGKREFDALIAQFGDVRILMKNTK